VDDRVQQILAASWRGEKARFSPFEIEIIRTKLIANISLKRFRPAKTFTQGGDRTHDLLGVNETS
jgi:hypothetical protein